jgi:FlaA1/EpsC-like NDP-sugar epimerase
MNQLKNRINEIITKITNDLNVNLNFSNLGYLPRWLILLIDVAIISTTWIVSYFLLSGLRLEFTPKRYLLLSPLIFLFFNIFYFWFYRTYSGIIRHSSYTDALKLFFSQFSCFGTIIIINTTLILLGHQKLCLTTGAFIYTILSFSQLFIYRVIVKQLFEKFWFGISSTKKTRVFIFGTDSNATAVANALKYEVPGKFNVVGFIDKNDENSTKRILDLPIIKIRKSIPVMMRYMKVEAIIMADASLNKEDKSIIVDQCIEYGFKAYSIPIITDLEDKVISKNIKNFEIQDLLERKPIILDTIKISQDIKNKVVLVTGAAGSIGSEIVRQIIKFSPKKIILIDQAETPLHNLLLEVLEQKNLIEIVCSITDIKDTISLENIFKNQLPEIVYHAAAYKHVPIMENNPEQAIFTNVIGTKNVSNLSKKYNVDRFVMVSTDKAVNPSSIMGASKRIAEMYVQSLQYSTNKQTNNHKTKFITTRFGNVLGSNGSVVPLFTKQIINGGPITITHPDIVRYFMTIPEACQLVLEASSIGNGGEIFIFDMGKPVKIIDLARKMIRLAGLKPNKDIQIKIIGLRPGEKLYEELLNDSAKNLPTHHEKITIAKEHCEDYDNINHHINLLYEYSLKKDDKKIVDIIKKIVPEYKSLNSIY